MLHNITDSTSWKKANTNYVTESNDCTEYASDTTYIPVIGLLLREHLVISVLSVSVLISTDGPPVTTQ